MSEICICTLEPEIQECKYRNKDNICVAKQTTCGFRKRDKTKKPYVKPEKWFEKYYKNE